MASSEEFRSSPEVRTGFVEGNTLTFPYDDFSLYPCGSPADPL